MKISTFLKIHPALTHAADIAEICKPLDDLGIVYFSHVHIDAENRMTAIGIKPEFFNLYFSKGYYHFDLHKKKQPLPKAEKFVLWDTIPLQKESLALHQAFTSFEQDHTFSIIYQNGSEKDCYHFAAKPSDISANARYFQQLPLLKKFIAHFMDKIHRHKELTKAYDLKIKLDANHGGYFSGKQRIFCEGNAFHNATHVDRFYLYGSKKYVTKRELEVLHWLSLGKTIDEIAIILNLTERTVKAHIANMKNRLECYNHFQLGMIYKELVDIIGSYRPF